MAITVATLVSKLERRFHDFNTPAVQLEYINAVHADICRQLPIITAVEDLSITAETQEYACNEADIRILAVEYVVDATDGGRRTLEETDLDYLRAEERNYLRRGSGTPSRWYLTRLVAGTLGVGLISKPSQSTSGTYPLVRCHVTRVETLVGGSSLPSGLLTYDAYVYGAQMRFAMDNREYSGEVAGLKALYDEAVAAERKVFDNRSPYRRRISPQGIGMGGVK